ncbi:MFS transporter [Corynebacterium variabile]|uniref:MFS transporter n=1 Tax=Corynebacterium variabile TaxID=1727 RepID=UPI0028AE4019|nr:MFS transporter [Corynebacterium variabile]
MTTAPSARTGRGSPGRHRKVRANADPDRSSRGIVGWSLGVSAVSTIMMTLDITIVLVALPAIREDLGLTLSGSQWVINAYSLTFASLMLAAASLSDIIGRRTIFLIGHVVFLAASIGCTVTGSEAGLIAFRALQGAGGALVFGTATPLLSDAFSPDDSAKRTKAVAAMMGIGGAASAFGPLIGGALVETGQWKWIFAINIPIGVLVILATLFCVPDLHRRGDPSQQKAPRVAPFAMVLTVGALVLVNYGIIDGENRGWTDHAILAALIAGVLLFAALILWEMNKKDAAMVDFRLFGIPSFATVTFNAFASRMFSFGMLPFLVLWMSGQLGLSALEIGYVASGLAVPMIIFSAVGIRAVTWIPVGWVQAVGMVVVAAGLMLGLRLDVSSGWQTLLPMLVVMGAGTGLMLPHVMSLAVEVVPASRTGMASGLANTALPLGTAFGVAVYGAYLANKVGSGLDGLPIPDQFRDVAQEAAEAGQFRAIAEQSAPLAQQSLQFFLDGLHGIFIIAAVLALVGALASVVFIRKPAERNLPAGE